MNGLLCDADFLISLALVTESTHSAAKRCAESYVDEAWHMLDIVTYECAGVCSRKYDNNVAAQMVKFLKALPAAVHRVATHETEAWELFLAQSKKNVSFTDCANIIAARKYGWKIASFDAFYPKELLAEI